MRAASTSRALSSAVSIAGIGGGGDGSGGLLSALITEAARTRQRRTAKMRRRSSEDRFAGRRLPKREFGGNKGGLLPLLPRMTMAWWVSPSLPSPSHPTPQFLYTCFVMRFPSVTAGKFQLSFSG